ncbi:beta-galactosidase [Sulfolobus sp. A20]|uniref:beta-galactosidase BgaS n=1 Tax=Sulfolobaceae TaxID=118883 RepID=UPI0008460FEC|nr:MULTISPECIES: beta-galactosidase BgaS [unclassified Sulfolobus]TRM74084.1 glycoside hydrolase family 1 protein [Sulfolobus sp. E5]TRM77303.1 glycoside hydrolase family 1 protein [Sulfolobus sp. A20-N-F8]TRM86443.1 glycoside hydrolase family 1 protein [Sulfolobus sp. E3]TRM89023.1 glycoside hydrolase family 1 protein [Sulfolobus sp. C3]TRN04072.1 glycoside hydrolase family 1 protein [Sulfolobus sp. F1]
MISFPKSFKFGWSQAGFQSEMGTPGSEDPNSDWYAWVHDQENIASGLVSGDFPENGPGYWGNYKMFHDNAEKMGLKIARIGVEWSRIFPKPLPKPEGFDENKNDVVHVEINENVLRRMDEYANKDAINHYREIFTDLKSRGFHFVLNMYHWPMPLWLHDPIRVRKGDLTGPIGWLSTRTVYEFARFTAYVTWKLDDLVDEYSTMNEPNVVFGLGYVGIKSGFPPGYLSFQLAQRARYNIIQAHARAYDAIKSLTKKNVGIIYANSSFQPLTDSDREAVEMAEHSERWSFFDAIIKGEIVKDNQKAVRDDLRNKLDWIGVNYYTRTVVKKTEKGYTALPGYGHGCERNSVSLAGLPTSDFGWEFFPEGLNDVLTKYWNRYHLYMYVTENGIADDADYQRPYYLVSHLYQVNRAIDKGVDVRGYLHWSLADNYEWASGFSMKFGLLKVDYSTKKQYWRPSALVYREITKNQGIPDEIQHLNSIPPVKPLRH